MAEEITGQFKSSGWDSSPSAPAQGALGFPPVQSLGSVSSMSAGPFSFPLSAGKVRNEARAAAEAAAGDAFYRRQEYARAWERYRAAAALNPSNPVFHFSLGSAALLAGRSDLAEQHMLDVLKISPNHGNAHEALAQRYMETFQLDLALKHSEAALLLDPRDIDFVVTRAAVLTADGQATAAWELLKPLLDAGVKNQRMAILYSRLAPRQGHEQQALEAVEWSLRAGVNPMVQSRYHFAAASLLDRLGRYDEAFEQAGRAHALVSKPFDPDAAVGADQKIAYYTPQRLRCLPKSTLDSGHVVFIVGMPRSGTTLVEQILASHPRVTGGGESTALLQTYREVARTLCASGAAFPDCLDSLALSSADRLARRYHSVLGSPGKATYITDKAPLNWLHLGLIELLLPNCRIIHCTRNPLDTCVSCYLTDFASGHQYAHDLENLGAMFRHYQRLMAHWKRVLTVPILEVRYEDLVLDAEAQSRRMTDFLNLPWDERCLKFYENRRRVHTASYEQVRQPIYLSSIARWKNYQKHIGKLIESLATA